MAENSSTAPEVPKNRYERLENRISTFQTITYCETVLKVYRSDELETLLQQKERESSSSAPPQLNSLSHSHSPESQHAPLASRYQNPNGDPNFSFNHGRSPSDAMVGITQSLSSTSSGGMGYLNGQYQPARTNSYENQTFSHIAEVRSPTDDPALSPSAPGLEMVWPNWPPDVPQVELLRHL